MSMKNFSEEEATLCVRKRAGEDAALIELEGRGGTLLFCTFLLIERMAEQMGIRSTQLILKLAKLAVIQAGIERGELDEPRDGQEGEEAGGDGD